MSRQLVSVIIPAYNAAATLESCLEGCLRQRYEPTEIIVVDDGSSDDTPVIAERLGVRVIRQKNQGPAAARNHGARIAGGSLLVFTDADCIPGERWLENLVPVLNNGVVAVGGGYENATDKSLLSRMIHDEIALRHSRLSQNVDFLGSFNFAVRREVFEGIGGFDESFRHASGEDNDLSYRLTTNGGRFAFRHDAAVAHHHPTKLWPYLRAQFRHGYWRMKLYAKHPRRADGDGYAGILDFAAPPVALLCLGALLVFPIAFFGYAALWAWAGGALLALLALLHVPMTARLIRRSRDSKMALFLPVTMVRSVARGLGMVFGIWTFWILGKGR